jgi:hypothetical protein
MAQALEQFVRTAHPDTNARGWAGNLCRAFYTVEPVGRGVLERRFGSAIAIP